MESQIVLESFFDILCNFKAIGILKFNLPFPLDIGIYSFLDKFPHLSELTLPAHMALPELSLTVYV